MVNRLSLSVIMSVVAATISVRAAAQTNVPLEYALPTYQSSALLEYAGYYEIGQHHPVIISYRTMEGGKTPVLMLTDLKTDAVRALFESGADRFVIGPELTRRDPVEAELRFSRPSSGHGMQLEFVPVKGRPERGERIDIETRDLEFEHDGITFGATVYTPSVDSPAPGALVVQGSGSDDADRYSLDALPWVLASRGFVVLAYDKRGVGASGGTHRIDLQTRADDAVAAIRELRRHPFVDHDRIGVFGYSEGAALCPMIAKRDGDVAFLVPISGQVPIKADGILWRMRNEFIEAGLSGDQLEEAVDAQRTRMVGGSIKRFEAGADTDFDRRLLYDNTDDWESYDGAVLYLLGEWDMLIDSVTCAEWLRTTMPKSGSRDWTVKVFPRAHHPMFLGTTGLHSEFKQMRGMSHFVPGYWATMLHWLDERFTN